MTPRAASTNGPAAIDDEWRTGGKGGIVASEEQRHFRDFFGLADAAEGRNAVDGALGHGAAALDPRDHRDYLRGFSLDPRVVVNDVGRTEPLDWLRPSP